ncbi:MAG: 4-alpha-glucanotransferase [Acetobacteraceae bacterium]|nr:4-alpha-glucanotransferase [Acetobacteraceae bacterium]
MTDEALRRIAAAHGIAPTWRDVWGEERAVSPDTLRAVLAALGAEGEVLPEAPPALILSRPEERPLLPGARPGPALLLLEDGRVLDIPLAEAPGGADAPPIPEPGLHRIEAGGRRYAIAVCPRRCLQPADLSPDRRPWGLAVQVQSLPGPWGAGDFAAVAETARRAAARGADALAISPVHAQFAAAPARFAPYSPSSRLMLNPVHAALPPPDPPLPAPPLIAWEEAGPAKWAALRAAFAAMDPAEAAAFAAFRAARGEALSRFALFEALHAGFARQGLWDWRRWPLPFRDPASAACAAFAAEHAAEVAFHAYAQFRADASLAAAQRAAREGGMRIGLIADLAVGFDPAGAEAWAGQHRLLRGLTIGAPPDLLNDRGQGWGLCAYSPQALRAEGFAGFRALLGAAFRHAGGIRIDHVMGFARLWVIPEGASPAEGAYLAYPAREMLALTALESWRHRAIAIGEDLGTLPPGFRAELAEAGLLGLAVLPFEREGGRFTPPGNWRPGAVAMTTTHDLPTIAGWWAGRDIAWHAALGWAEEAQAREARGRDRRAFWDACRESGAAAGEPPPEAEGRAAAAAAIAQVARSSAPLVLVAAEDALAETEAPNLPGTVDEHPNWRRRLPAEPAESPLLAPLARA